MKRIPVLIFLALAFAALAVTGRAQSLGMNMVWTTPSAAATVTADASGTETSGPVLSFLYRTPATITAGVASCPAFSTTAYTLLTPNGIPGTSSAANANTYSDPISSSGLAVGSLACYAVTDQYQAGGAVSSATLSIPLLAVLVGNATPPASVSGSFGPVAANSTPQVAVAHSN